MQYIQNDTIYVKSYTHKSIQSKFSLWDIMQREWSAGPLTKNMLNLSTEIYPLLWLFKLFGFSMSILVLQAGKTLKRKECQNVQGTHEGFIILKTFLKSAISIR